MLRKSFWFVVFILFVHYQAGAREITQYVGKVNIPQQFFSMRAMGMGNAFTAVADDATGLLYNPAGLARRKDGVFRGSFAGGLSPTFFDFVDDVSKANDTVGDDEAKVNAVLDVFKENAGEVYHSRTPRIYGAYARPHWGIVFIPFDATNDMVINSNGGPSINMNLTQDSTFAFGYGTDVDWFKKWMGLDGQLSVGVTGKLIHRIFLGQVLMANTLVAGGGDLFDTKNASEGLTVDADLGMMFTPKLPDSGWLSTFKAAKPTFSVVLRNALDMGFTQNLKVIGEDSNQPPNLGRRLDIGSEWDLPDFWVFDPHMSFDVRDIMHENWSLKKGIHIGAELYWKMFDWWKGSWQVGLNDGYPSFGVGARFAWFNLDLLSYGEEMGVTSSSKESRRYMLEMSVEF